VYRAKQWQLAPGAFFGLFLVLLFMVRFAVEFVKEDQVAFERGMALNMGQWLSLPYMAVGLGLLAWALWRKKKSPSVG
jgi:prolipoprotein diacylglyceryltransferase